MLPKNRVTGVQLGLGVQSSAVFLGDENGQRWLKSTDEKCSSNHIGVHVVSKGTVINPVETEDAKDDEDEDEDILSESSGYDFDDDEEFSHWKNVLVSKMEWKDLSPIIPANFQVFTKVNLDRKKDYDVRGSVSHTAIDHISESLISELSENNRLISNRPGNDMRRGREIPIFDPTMKERFQIGPIQTASDLRNGKDPRQIIAYSSGSTNSTLNLTVLSRTNVRINNSKINEGVDVSTWSINDFTKIESKELRSPIKRIVFPKLSDVFGRQSDVFGVITESSIQIIKIHNIGSRTNKISYSTYDPLYFSDLSDFPFADFAFNPWDMQEIAIIDIKGNWFICRIPKTVRSSNKIIVSQDIRGTIFDAEELSNWKGIEWSSKYTRLLLLDRSKLVEVDFQENWQIEVAQAKTWSTLRDFKRFNDKFSILLTSKEIIVLNTWNENDGISRDISWKHDLDPKDNSLKMSLQTLNRDGQLAVKVHVFSRRNNKVYVHGFSMEEGNEYFRSFNNSKILKFANVRNGIEGISFINLDNHSEDAIMSYTEGNENDDEIWTNIYVKEYNNESIRKYMLSNVSAPEANVERHVHFSVDEVKDLSLQNKKTNISDEIISLINKIVWDTENLRQEGQDENNVYEKFQTFGYELSTAMSTFIGLLKEEKNLPVVRPSLKQLIDLPEFSGNIPEFDPFLEQFIDHFNQGDIAFSSLNSIFAMLLNENIESMTTFYKKLLQCWNNPSPGSDIFSKEVVKSIVWSSIRFFNKNRYDPLEEKIGKELSQPYKKILDTWDMTDAEFEQEAGNIDSLSSTPFNSQPQFSFNNRSQIPAIKSSQPIKKPKRGISSSIGKVSKPSRNRISLPSRYEQQASSFSTPQPTTLPDNMTPAFSLMQAGVPTLSQLQSSQSSQKGKKKKKRVGGFG